jgi:hypothetical protein
MSFSLFLRLHCGGCAASHANREKEIREYANCFRRASHDGGVDAGLRRGRRKLCSAPAATSSFHRGYGREKRLMNIVDAGNFMKEIGGVGMLGITGKLATAVLRTSQSASTP